VTLRTALINWLAQQISDPTGGSDVLLQYGAIGVFALAGIWATIYLYRRSERQHELERELLRSMYLAEKERGDRFEEALLALHTRVGGEVVNKLVEATNSMREWADVMRYNRGDR
jgi:hypothetical protein